MSENQMWSLIAVGSTPDDGDYTVANFTTKERALQEKEKLEKIVKAIESNTDSSLWGGWSIFPSRYRVEPMPAMVEDGEEFSPKTYFLVFTTSTLSEDKTRLTREVEHVEFSISAGLEGYMVNAQEQKAFKEMQETGKKYVSWNTPVVSGNGTIVFETLFTLNAADIPLEDNASAVGL